MRISSFDSWLRGLPPLNKNEQLAYLLLGDLQREDLRHRYQNIPYGRQLWQFGIGMLLRPFFSTKKWIEILERRFQRARCFEYERKPALPLAELWERTRFSRDFSPNKAESETLWFDDFFVCRRSDFSRKFGTFLGADYFVVGPSETATFRCLATELSGRIFHTQQARTNCVPPAKDDFGIVPLRSKAFDEQGFKLPCVLNVALPMCYGPWELLKPWDSDQAECILFDGDQFTGQK